MLKFFDSVNSFSGFKEVLRLLISPLKYVNAVDFKSESVCSDVLKTQPTVLTRGGSPLSSLPLTVGRRGARFFDSRIPVDYENFGCLGHALDLAGWVDY